MKLARAPDMKTLCTLFLLLGWLAGSARAVNESIWLTNAAFEDTITVRVGETLEVHVRVDSDGTAISGFQCFVHVDEELAETVRYNESPVGWFQDMDIFHGLGQLIFADDHDSRFPNDPLPGHQLDWCIQTGISQPRPAYTVNGSACTFRLRFLQPIDGLVLGFDHDNNHFRNTLYWEGQSAVEHPFYHEHPLVINVIGMEFGPLPDVYLTSETPRDSLNMVDYLDGLLNVNPDSVWYSVSPLATNDVCDVDTLRLPGAYWLGFTGTGPGTQVDLEVTAHYQNLTALDTLRVYRGDPPIIDDGMAAGDPFVIWEEDGETWLDFDDWVSDLDDPVETLSWSVLQGEYTVSLTVDAGLRRGHFTAPGDWFGWDTLLVRVTDPGGMADTSRLVTRVTPVNDPPMLELPELVEVHPGQPLYLDLEELTHDIDDSYDLLYWEVLGDTSEVAVRVNHTDRTLMLEVQAGTPLWSFVDVAVRVTDSGLLTDEDSLHMQVASHPPLWDNLGEVLVPSGGIRQLDLNEWVADVDNPDSELTLSLTGLVQVGVVVDPVSHVATFSAPSGWTGVEWALAHAQDPDGNTDTDSLLVVSLQGGNPVVALVPDLVFLPGQRDTLYLDPHVWDLDTPDGQMSWSVENSGTFHTIVEAEQRRVIYTAPPLAGRTDLSYYRATDPEGHWAEDVGSLAVIDPSGRPVIFPLAEVWMRVNAVDSSLVLDAAVYDYDHDPEQLSWSVGAGTLVSGSVRASDRRLFIQSGFASGSETLQLHVEDPDGLSADGPLVVHVTEGNAPIVSAFAPRFIVAGRTDTLSTLSSWVYDEDENESISWSFIDPPGGVVQATWDAAHDRALFQADPAHRGVDPVGAVATDQAHNSDMEWITVTTLENVPPQLELAVLPNPVEPRLLDVVAVSDEALRSLTGSRASDGAGLSFTEMVVSAPRVRIHRADLVAPDGVEVWRIQAMDLPGYPQVAGNVTTDSLVLGSALLARPGDQLAAPDGGLRLEWLSGLSNGRWVVRELGPPEGRQWRISGPNGGRVRLEGVNQGLEIQDGALWRPVTAEDRREGVPAGSLARPALGGVPGEDPAEPAGFALHPAWPNPFNPETMLEAELPVDGVARLEIHDLAGRRLRTLLSGPQPAGRQSVRWDGLDQSGRPVASGIYFAWLRQEQSEAVQKLILLK